MRLIYVALRNLAFWQPRNFGALAGIVIAIASFVALVGLARGVQDTLLNALETRGTDVLITEAGALDLISSIVPERLASEAEAIPGVVAAAPELTRLTTLDDGRSVVVVAWPIASYPWQGMTLESGRLPTTADRHAVVLGEGLTQRMNITVGDTISLFHETFDIVGTVTSPALLARSAAYAALGDVQALTFREGQATSINIQTKPKQTDQTIRALRKNFPDLSVETTQKLGDNYLFGRLANVLAFAISTVALVSSVLVIFNTMSTAVNARRGEIAILSAIGWSRWHIVAMLLIEGCAIALIAGLAGILAGVLLAHGVAAHPQIVGFIDPVIDAGLLFKAFGVSLGVGLFGSLVPSLRAVRRPPAEILRGH